MLILRRRAPLRWHALQSIPDILVSDYSVGPGRLAGRHWRVWVARVDGNALAALKTAVSPGNPASSTSFCPPLGLARRARLSWRNLRARPHAALCRTIR